MNRHGWPGGRPFDDDRTLTRGGSAGDLAVRYSPGVGNELILIGGQIQNNGTIAINLRARVFNAAGASLFWVSAAVSVSAGATYVYPSTDDTTSSILPGTDIIVSGTQYLEARGLSVNAAEALRFAASLRYVGAAPTISVINA